MIAPALRSTARASVARSLASSSARRTLLTKAEKWDHTDAAAALEAPDQKVALADVVPNIEARWASMSKVEQYAVYRQLEEVQRKDWKDLSLDEKKAAYFVSFGPHGPRKPVTQPGQAVRTLAAVSFLIGATGVVFYAMRQYGGAPVKTMTKEWQEQSNQRSLDEKINPISGISSEGYKGTGHVQSK
ncbi:unnamed protein product [Parajaminaea phylloscopi]